MNYEEAAEKYMATRQAIEAADKAHKASIAGLKEKMAVLEHWITAKAQEDGLTTIKTATGTAYWAVHNTATVGSRDALFDYCKEHGTWDLVESRVSKTATKAFIEAHGAPPPGVNFASVSVFNFRKANPTE